MNPVWIGNSCAFLSCLLRRFHYASVLLLSLNLASAIARASLDPGKDITQYVQKSWQTEQGLPENSVTAIAQTNDGYLWFGTESGLARFDGIRFTIFDHNSTPGLAGSMITALLVDRQGTLWIGTHEGGLSVLRDGIISRFPLQQDLASNAITCLYEDADGIWIGTDSAGISIFNNDSLRRLTVKDGLVADAVVSITGNRQHDVWIATPRGISRSSPGFIKNYTLADGLPVADIRSLLASQDGSLWVGTYGAGLLRLDPSDHKFSPISGLSGKSVSSVYEDSVHTIWVGTLDGGLNRWSHGTLAAYSHRDGFAGSGVWSILEDKAGALWIGGTESGLSELRDGSITAFTTQQGLAGDVSLATFQDKTGALWIGSDSGLTRWQDGRATRFTIHEGLPDNLVFSVAQDGEGTIWVGTRNGFARLVGGRFQVMNQTDGHPYKGAYPSLYTDHSGSLWIGSRGTLNHLDRKTLTAKTVRDGLPDKLITSMYQDNRDALWLGTDGGGLVRLKNDTIRIYSSRDGLPSDVIYAITADGDDSLWLATGGKGLVHFQANQFTQFTRADGLLDDALFSIADDQSGRLWMSSDRGLASISKSDLDAYAKGKLHVLPVRKYGTVDGMRNRECNGGFQNSCARTNDGRLWFPTLKGVVAVDPKKASALTLPFPVLLERFSVDSKPVTLLHSLEIPPGKRRFAFQFSAPGALVPEKVEFSYLLEGFDRDWVQSGSDGVANYTNVPPGTYRLRVKACIEDSCSAAGSEIPLIIRPAFYETSTFFGLVVLTLATGVFALHKIRVAQLKHSERTLQNLIAERTNQLRDSRDHLERRVQERTRDLESEVRVRREAEQKAEAANVAKTEFLTNMSHEIRTPINGIMGMVDITLSTVLTEEQHEYLSIVKTSADSLLRIVNDILDFSKIEARKIHFEDLPFTLSECLDQVLKLVTVHAHEKGLDLRLHIAPDVPDGLVGDPWRLRQVILNLLNNAIKFTMQGSVCLSVQVESTSDRDAQLRFTVTDTGIGIPKEKQSVIFEAFSQADNSSTRRFGGTGLGLTISSQLVQLMNGRIWVESEPGRGSTFAFTAVFTLPSPAENSLLLAS